MSLILLTLATFAAFQLMVLAYVLAQALVGRSVGARVEVVCVGFGPTLLRKRFGSVEYGYAIIPTGGYTRFRGDDADVIDDVDGPDSVPFNRLPPAARMLVALSGPGTSIVVGLLLLTGATFLPRSGAAIGAAVPVRPSAVPGLGVTNDCATVESQVALFRHTFVEFWRRLASLESLRGWGGWIGALMTTAAASQESAGAWLSCFGVLCVAGGFLNLLPIPPLNGGAALLLAVEIVRGPLGDHLYTAIVSCGILVVLVLFATIAYQDVVWVLSVLSG